MNQRAIFPLKAVLTSSETLLPFQRETIEKSFQCKIFDYFGMAERVAFATECENHTGHHFNMDYGITEIVDKNGEPIENGKMGRIVGTSIHNLAMPLIRYETNDVTSIQKKKCPCGREFPLIGDVATRTEDIVVTKDGRMISPTVLMYPFDPLLDKIEMSQIIQDDVNNITVKIVKRPQYSQQDTNLLLSGLHERVGDDMEIKLEFVDSIPTDPSGKFQFVISKVELPI